jgi:hypothetical protein
MTDDDDDAAFRSIVLETKGKVDHLYELVRPYFEQQPPAAAPEPSPQSPPSDDEPTREELMDLLVQKNRQMQLMKIRNDWLEYKLEQYEPKDDEVGHQEYDD